MIAAILAFLSQSWVGQLFTAALNWYAARKAAQDGANNAEQSAETAHQTDGAQSVQDRTSADAQNAALDQLQDQLEHPTPVVVTSPGEKKT